MNISELIEAGVAFSIVSEEPDFTSDGELRGYVAVDNPRYTPPSVATEDAAQMRGFFECDTIGEGLEDGALLDDDGLDVEPGEEFGAKYVGGSFLSPARRNVGTGPKRWRTEELAWEDEQAYIARTARPVPSDNSPNWAALAYTALERERRVAKLISVMRHLAFKAKAARRAGDKASLHSIRTTAQLWRKQVRGQYVKTITTILARQKNEWWAMYLTKEQKQHVERCFNRLLSLC